LQKFSRKITRGRTDRREKQVLRFTYHFRQVPDQAWPTVRMLDALVPGTYLFPKKPRGREGPELDALLSQWFPSGCTTPDHGAWLVDAWLNSVGVQYHADLGALSTPLLSFGVGVPLHAWNEAAVQEAATAGLEELINRGLVRDWLAAPPEGGKEYLTPYQKRVIGLTAKADLSLWWSPGCLTGDTLIGVNRGGNGTQIPLEKLVKKFKGEKYDSGRMWDLSIPTRVQAMDEEGSIRLANLEAVHENGVVGVFELITESGRIIRATEDHRFYVEDSGFIRLRDLNVGNRIAVAQWPRYTDSPKPPKPPKDPTKAYYKEVQHMWNHPNCVRRMANRKDRCGHRRTAIVPEHRLVMEAHLNRLSLAELVGRIVLGQTDGIRFLSKDSHVHHLNGNTRDNRRDNLEVYRGPDHSRLHGQQEGWRRVGGRATYEKIKEIIPKGREPVYDLTVEGPYHNYVANGFVVHNSGKSLAGILWGLCGIIGTGNQGGTVCVVTKSAIRGTWEEQVAEYVPLEKSGCPVDCTVWRAPSTRRKGYRELIDVASEADITFAITGWESLPLALEEILALRGNGPLCVIWDESHSSRSWKRKRAVRQEDDSLRFEEATTRSGEMPVTVAVEKLSRAASRRLATTATPVANLVRDLWPQLDAVEPWCWGGGIYPFARRYCAAGEGEFGGLDTSGASNLDELRARLGYCVYEVPYSVSHGALPPKRRRTVYLDPEHQCKELGGWKRDLQRALKAGRRNYAELRLMQAASRKRPYLLDRTAETVLGGGKVLIFTGRRKDCEELYRQAESKLGKKGVGGWWAHGGVDDRDRDKIRHQYMGWKPDDHGGKGCYLVTTMQSMGSGVSLHDTDLLLMGMLPLTWEQLWQVENRVSRLGMTRSVLIEFVVAVGSYDERVAALFLDKLPAIGALTQAEELPNIQESLEGLEDEEAVLDRLFDRLTAAEGGGMEGGEE